MQQVMNKDHLSFSMGFISKGLDQVKRNTSLMNCSHHPWHFSAAQSFNIYHSIIKEYLYLLPFQRSELGAVHAYFLGFRIQIYNYSTIV